MIKEKIIQDLEELYRNKPHRLQHVYGVVETAISLGTKHHCNTEKLELAALLHDITKYYSTEENYTLIESYFPNSSYIIKEFNTNILHAFSAVVVAHKKYGITDPTILGAIEHHTIGKPNMNLYEQILFVSDYIEPNRTYESSIRVRKIAYNSLDLATYTAIDDSITHYEQENGHIPNVAYQARDYYKRKLEETT